MKLHIIKENKSISLIAFGDIHYGDSSCNWEKAKRLIEYIKQHKETRVILMGDLINSATKSSVGAAVFDEDVHGQKQLDTIIEALYPIKDQIYGALMGNHEQRILNSTGYNPMKILSKALNIKYYGYGIFVKIKIGKASYNIYATHGSSGSKLPWTKIRGCLELSKHIDADIYLYGHVHDLQLLTMEVERVVYSQVIKDKKYFILTGHYLNYRDSYAEMKNMIPSKQGSPFIDLDKDIKKVRVKI